MFEVNRFDRDEVGGNFASNVILLIQVTVAAEQNLRLWLVLSFLKTCTIHQIIHLWLDPPFCFFLTLSFIHTYCMCRFNQTLVHQMY